jgi:hypothetical protein
MGRRVSNLYTIFLQQNHICVLDDDEENWYSFQVVELKLYGTLSFRHTHTNFDRYTAVYALQFDFLSLALLDNYFTFVRTHFTLMTKERD